MTRLRQESGRQLEHFLRAIFLPGELIELRFIESGGSHGKNRSRVVRAAQWLRSKQFVSEHREIDDFAIICDLLRLGLSREDIWPLVCVRSKFESKGRPYFDVTISNAERMVTFDVTTHSRSPALTEQFLA